MSKKLLGVTIDDNLSRKDDIKQQNLNHIPVNKLCHLFITQNETT